MELTEAIKTRRSIRKFKPESVSHETLEQIVAVSAYAPSWKNSQTAHYIVVEDPEKIRRIAAEAVLGFQHNTEIIAGCASLVVLVSTAKKCGYEKDGSYTTSKKDKWEMFDAGIAAQTFALAAHDQGVGTVILGIFDEAKVAEIIDLPEGQNVSALIAAGYPDMTPPSPVRKSVEELLEYR